MEIIVFLSVVIAVVAVLTSIVLVRRVKKQIAEMTDVLVDVKNGNGNRRILSATNELTAPLAYEINEIVVSYESRLSIVRQTEETNRQLQESDTLLADTQELQVVATGCKADESGGFTVSLYLENRTENDYSLTLENVKVNGQRCDPLWTRELVGGRRSFSDVNWFGADLEGMEIYTVTRVEFDLVATALSTGSSVLKEHCVIEP